MHDSLPSSSSPNAALSWPAKIGLIVGAILLAVGVGFYVWGYTQLTGLYAIKGSAQFIQGSLEYQGQLLAHVDAMSAFQAGGFTFALYGLWILIVSLHKKIGASMMFSLLALVTFAGILVPWVGEEGNLMMLVYAPLALLFLVLAIVTGFREPRMGTGRAVDGVAAAVLILIVFVAALALLGALIF